MVVDEREGERDGEVACVTGAGSGIGRAAAVALARRGAAVAVLGRTRDELEDLADDLGRDGAEVLVLEADIADARETAAAFRALGDRWGRCDTLVANAGVNGVWAPIDELEAEEFARTVDINLVGTFHTIKYAVPLLRRRGGSVVVTASVNGTRMFSNTGATAYAATKAGQVAMAKMLALELATDRIRVNAICPGAIDTDIDDNTDRRGTPENRRLTVELPEGKVPLTDGEPGTSAQVADLIAFLTSDAASHVTGAEVFIDGAQSLFQG